jgi:hypothetical protein
MGREGSHFSATFAVTVTTGDYGFAFGMTRRHEEHEGVDYVQSDFEAL